MIMPPDRSDESGSLRMCAATMHEEIASPLLAGYRPSERRAIIVHKYFLGTELGYDPGLRAAVDSWESRFANRWRRQRQIADCQAQIREIQRHRQHLCDACGQGVDWDAAARDWISHFASHWRSLREQQEEQTEMPDE